MEDGLARYDWSVPADANALIVELGANDMLRGLPPERTKTALTAILNKAAAAHLPTLIAGMRAAPNLGAEYDQAFDAIYPTAAKASGAILYPFFLDGVAGDARLNQPDGDASDGGGRGRHRRADAAVGRGSRSPREALRRPDSLPAGKSAGNRRAFGLSRAEIGRELRMSARIPCAESFASSRESD